ncbi:AraC family transcriptional regulator [Kitasatospora sp. NPDC094028]
MDDVLGELLAALRVRGVLQSHLRARAPWAVRGPAENCAVLHYVVAGSCWATLADEVRLPDTARHLRQARLRPGDLVIFPWGAPHTLGDRPWREALPLTAVLPDRTPGVAPVSVRLPGPGPETAMLCAGLSYNSVGESALYRALPPMLVLHREVVRRHPLLHHTLAALSAEHPGDPVEGELLRGFETALVLALRLALRGEAAERLNDDYPSLRALRHPGISRALTAVYARYSEQWTVDLLAREALMSRTGFTTVFRQLVGESPGRHLTARRMREAARLLSETDLALSLIPAAVGYRSSVGFHLAFRKWTGTTPGEYRDAHPGRRGTGSRGGPRAVAPVLFD